MIFGYITHVVMLVKTNYIDKEQCDIANVKTNHKLYLVHAQCTQSDKVTSSFLPDAAPDVMMMVSGFWFGHRSPLLSPTTSQAPFGLLQFSTSLCYAEIYIIGISFDRFMFTFT